MTASTIPAALVGALICAMLLACQGSSAPETPTVPPTAAPTATTAPASAPATAATPTAPADQSTAATRAATPTATPTAAQPTPSPTGATAATTSQVPNVPPPFDSRPSPTAAMPPPAAASPEPPTLSAVPTTEGAIRTEVMSTRAHFPTQMSIGDVMPGGYNTIPPTSGPHWGAWSDCGFYNYPLPDELLVHNLEHGNIIISHNLPEADQVAELRAAIAAVPLAAEYAIVRRYHQIPEGMVALTTWGVLDRMLGVDAERIARFFRDFPGNTGPEFPNGLPCTTGVQMTPSSGG